MKRVAIVAMALLLYALVVRALIRWLDRAAARLEELDLAIDPLDEEE